MVLRTVSLGKGGTGTRGPRSRLQVDPVRDPLAHEEQETHLVDGDGQQGQGHGQCDDRASRPAVPSTTLPTVFAQLLFLSPGCGWPPCGGQAPGRWLLQGRWGPGEAPQGRGECRQRDVVLPGSVAAAAAQR